MNAPMGPDAVPEINAPGLHFQWEEPQQAHVLVCPEGMVKLNPSAGEILALCDGERSIGAIIAALEARFPGAELDQDVHRFLEVALENGWIRIR
jgi:pyrroloquinoline quinone biosynthesis protein D